MSAEEDGFEDIEAPRLDVEPLLPWPQAPLATLLSSRSNRHHAMLLHGPSGSGLRRFALHLAQGMLCRTPRSDGLACATCDACGLFAAGNHPDFRLVERQWVRKTKESEPRLRDLITIDQVRALIDDFLYLTSHLQGAKVVVIHLAEEMNAPAANALLKSLEEPPEATYFILVSHQLRLLKPTIVSRCRRMPAPQPAPVEAEAWLSAQSVEDANVTARGIGGTVAAAGTIAPATRLTAALAQAGGAPLRALAMLEPEYQSERVRFLERLCDPGRMSIAAMGAELESGPRGLRKARLELWIEWLTTWTYDLARLSALRSTGAADVQAVLPHYHVDFAKPLTALAAKVAAVPVLRYHRSLLQDRALLSHPLNPRLVVENALHGYQTVAAQRASG